MIEFIVDVAAHIESGRLEQVLPGWSGGEMPIVALFASRHHQPRKLQVFLTTMPSFAALDEFGDATGPAGPHGIESDAMPALNLSL